MTADYRAENTPQRVDTTGSVIRHTEAMLTFRLEDRWFAVAVRNINEIAPYTAIHHIPHNSNELFLGLVNINGSVCVCYSLKYLLDVEAKGNHNTFAKSNTFRRLIVVKLSSRSYVFQVDEIGGIDRYDNDEFIQDSLIACKANDNLFSGAYRTQEYDVTCINTDKLTAMIETQCHECAG